MNKTNYITLIILLCFSIVFVVYPIKTQAGPPYDFLSDEANAALAGYIEEQEEPPAEEPPAEEPPAEEPPAEEPPAVVSSGGNNGENGTTPLFSNPDGTPVTSEGLGDIVDHPGDEDYAPPVGESEFGDTFTGASGTTYVFKPETFEPGEQEYEQNVVGVNTIGTWVEVEEETPSSTTSSTNGTTDTTNGPTDTTNGTTDTTNGTPDTTNTTTPRCVLIRSYTPCVNTCGSGGGNGGYTPPVWTPPVSPPPVSPPPVSPPPTCEIYEFSINDKTNEERDPLLVWVNASLRGLISTNTDCTKCTVESTDTWGNDPGPKEYAINFANNYKAKESFSIPEAPWWREIIPVLPGSLFSSWPWK